MRRFIFVLVCVISKCVFAMQAAPSLQAIFAADIEKNLLEEVHKLPSSSALHENFLHNPLFTVVIDPGHGGHDTGAKGIYGTEEKNIVLTMARQLAWKINHQPGMHALLTRTQDTYVGLRERIKFARDVKADIFIAIHADWYFNHHAKGVSLYALSPRGATSEAARWLAQRNRYDELGDVSLDALADQSLMLRSVLIDLAQTKTIQNSLHLGDIFLDALQHVTTLHYARTEQAPFAVLKSPDIPSVLVETGFLSNAEEEQRLNNVIYQEKIVQALWEGTFQFYEKYFLKNLGDNSRFDVSSYAHQLPV
jgi:N-acetylmuramoyl-L-alanine amidase